MCPLILVLLKWKLIITKGRDQMKMFRYLVRCLFPLFIVEVNSAPSVLEQDRQ